MEIERFLGDVTWLSGNILTENDGEQPTKATIKRAILNENKLNIETQENNDEEGGQMKLFSSDGINFSGTFSYNSSHSPDAKLSLKYYSNVSGGLLLGDWIQQTYIYTTIIQLKKVSEFPT